VSGAKPVESRAFHRETSWHYTIFTIVSQTIPSSYYFPAALTVLLIAITRAYCQGRRTNRDRDYMLALSSLRSNVFPIYSSVAKLYHRALSPFGSYLARIFGQTPVHTSLLLSQLGPSPPPRRDFVSSPHRQLQTRPFYAEPCRWSLQRNKEVFASDS